MNCFLSTDLFTLSGASKETRFCCNLHTARSVITWISSFADTVNEMLGNGWYPQSPPFMTYTRVNFIKRGNSSELKRIVENTREHVALSKMIS